MNQTESYNQFMVNEHIYDGIEMLEDQTEQLNFRLEKIESLLKQYLKPNTREDMDRLEQRFRMADIRLRELYEHIFYILTNMKVK